LICRLFGRKSEVVGKVEREIAKVEQLILEREHGRRMRRSLGREMAETMYTGFWNR
jgi:argininosuccinate synthase